MAQKEMLRALNVHGGTDPRLLPIYMKALEARNPAALPGISRFGPKAAAAVPLLIKMLADDNEQSTRSGAAQALESIGPGARAAAPLLLRLLKEDPDVYFVRPPVAKALASVEERAEVAVPALIDALRFRPKRHPQLQLAAVQGLARYGPKAASAVPDLIEVIALGERPFLGDTCAEAARCLGLVGAAAQSAIPTLKRGLTDDEATTRFACAGALYAIDSSMMEGLSVLEHATSERLNLPETLTLLDAVRRFGPSAKGLAPKIRGYLSSRWEDARAAACETLGLVGAADPDTIAALELLAASDPWETVRVAAQEAASTLKAGSKTR